MAATKTQHSADSNPFIKQLASSDRSIRDRALSSIRTYLAQPNRTFASLDLLKLWKGLYYCMFMSDKPRNQQRLARDLADLTDVLAPANVIPWLESFWKTMAREWGGIDSLRMDKYLYLVRCYVGKGFDVCSKKKWNTAFVEEYIRMLREDGGPLSSRDSKVPAGLKLHVLDVWVDELEKVDGEKKKADLEQVMGPIKELQKETPVKSVRVRAKETVEDERFVDGKAWKEKDGEESEDHENGQSGNGDDFGGFDD